MPIINELTGEIIETEEVQLRTKLMESVFDKDFYDNALLIINYRKEKLNMIAAKLKEDFVGLDDCIDKIIGSISAWYCMPEILTRPTIVCLWGLTGVGKTDLVRKLVRYMEMVDNFVEIQMANNGSGWDKKIQGLLTTSNISTEVPGILLLDEIQRFRSVNEKGDEIHDYHYQDVWTLLSDGNFGNNSRIKNDLLELIYEDYYYSQFRDNNDDDETTDETTDDTTTTKNGIPLPQKKKKKKNHKFKQSFYSAQKIKNMLRLTESVDEIMTWDTATKVDTVLKKMEDKTAYKDEVYRKLLIFISGNLDEAFVMADDTCETDIDADYFHEQTKKINVLTIKEKLLKRFKPEQIARLGNCHVIYPSLNKASYNLIINRKINEITGEIYNNCGVRINIDDSVRETIYRNGVFPVQGTRPLFSTISTFFESSLPHFIINALSNNTYDINIRYDDKHLISDINGNEIKLFIEGDIDKVVEKKKDINNSCKVAVHESGHAVAYAVLFGVSPTQISINLADNHSRGFVFNHAIYGSRKQYLDMIKVCLAGRVGEEIVFGSDNISSGNTVDLSNATQYAAQMVRQCNMADFESYVVVPNDQRAGLLNTDALKSNPLIENIVKIEKSNTISLINDNINLIIELSQYLIKNNSIKPDVFVEICGKHGVNITELNTRETVIPPFKEMFDQFLSNQ